MNIDVSRLKRLMDARARGISEGMKMEEQITSELVPVELREKDPACLRTAHGESIDVTPFCAVEKLGEVLENYLPVEFKGKYDPKFAPARIVIDLWRLRQLIDQMGLPYDIYVATAATYLGKPKGRAPRLSQLMRRDVIAHVAREWAGKP